jgi:prolyl-tRNA synthetase
VLADSGEDAIAFSDQSDYAANAEMAEAVAPASPRLPEAQAMEKVATPGKKTIDEVSEFLQVPSHRIVKAIAVMNGERFHLLLLRGDHELNEVKARKLAELSELRFAEDEEIERHMNCRPGYIGPVGLAESISVIADRAVLNLNDFVCGANDAGFHYTGVSFGRDLPEPSCVADLRKVVEGDPSPDGKGTLRIARGIEVGHIFQLGTKYSAAMKAEVLNEQGQSEVAVMGCYGIGVSRVVAAAIEQNHDDRGVIWPEPIAPFHVALVPINMHTSDKLAAAADTLYDELCAAGFEVLYDDRKARPGVMFADMELIGIPHRVVISERGLEASTLEYRGRRDAESQNVPLVNIIDFLHERMSTSG